MASLTLTAGSEIKTVQRFSPLGDIQTYSREEMLMIRSNPVSCRRPSFLAAEFNDDKGLFAPVKWFDNKFSQEKASNGRRKQIALEELGLSPQRRQFAAGCASGKDGKTRNNKAAALKDGENSQPKEKEGLKWRTAPERNQRKNQTTTNDDMPEWLESKVSITDMIELKGFDSRRNKKSNESNKPVTTASKEAPDNSSEPQSANLSAPDEDALLKELQRSSRQNNENSKPIGTTGSRFIGFFRAKEAQQRAASVSTDSSSTTSAPAPLQEVSEPAKIGELNAIFGAADNEKWPKMPVNIGILASDFEKNVNSTDSYNSDCHELLPELTNSIRNPPTVVCGKNGDVNGISALDRWVLPEPKPAASPDVVNPVISGVSVLSDKCSRDNFVPTDPKPDVNPSRGSPGAPASNYIDPWSLFPQAPPIDAEHSPVDEYAPLDMAGIDELLRNVENFSPFNRNVASPTFSEKNVPIHKPIINNSTDNVNSSFINKPDIPNGFMFPNPMYPVPGIPPMHPMMMRMPWGIPPPGMFVPNQFNRPPVPRASQPPRPSAVAFPGGSLPTAVILKKSANVKAEKSNRFSPGVQDNNSRRGSSSQPSDNESVQGGSTQSSAFDNVNGGWPLPPTRDANGGPTPMNQEAIFQIMMAQAMMSGVPPPPNMFPHFPGMRHPMMPPHPMESGFPPLPFFPPLPRMPMPSQQPHRQSPGLPNGPPPGFPQYTPSPPSPAALRDNANIPESILRSLPTTARPLTLADLEASILSKN